MKLYDRLPYGLVCISLEYLSSLDFPPSSPCDIWVFYSFLMNAAVRDHVLDLWHVAPFTNMTFTSNSWAPFHSEIRTAYSPIRPRTRPQGHTADKIDKFKRPQHPLLHIKGAGDVERRQL